MEHAADETVVLDERQVPYPILQEAVQSVIRTLDVQVGLPLQVVDDPIDPREAQVRMGSSIALTSETGRWNLAVMADAASCGRLTSAFFALEEGDQVAKEDIADAMGEIANVAAGVFKAKRAESGQNVLLGLPLFMEGTSCFEFFARGIQGISQTIRGVDGVSAHVILIWEQGTA